MRLRRHDFVSPASQQGLIVLGLVVSVTKNYLSNVFCCLRLKPSPATAAVLTIWHHSPNKTQK